MSSNIVYIGISAKRSGKRSGKDTLSDFLMARFQAEGFLCLKRSLADPLKNACAEIYGLSHEQMYGTQEQKESLTNWDWPAASGKTGKMTAREILQYFGTEVMRDGFDQEIWIKSLKAYAENYAISNRLSHLIVFVPDIRYPNEAEAMDTLIDVYRKQAEDANNDGHKSELSGALIPDEWLDAVVNNSDEIPHLEVAAEELYELIAPKLYLTLKEKV